MRRSSKGQDRFIRMSNGPIERKLGCLSFTMKEEWNRRARENARYHVVPDAFESDETFDASGFRDAALVIDDLTWDTSNDKIALEVGCGLGRLLKPLSRVFKEVHGVDVSEEYVRLARERLAVYRNIFLHVSGGTDLSEFEDNTFDLVFSLLVFEHIPAELVWRYCLETHRILKPGGIFRFQWYARGRSIRRAMRWLARGRLKSVMLSVFRNSRFEVGEWPTGSRSYTKEEIFNKLSELGFRNIGFREDPCRGPGSFWFTCQK